MIEVEEGSRAAAPKGPMTYAFTYGDISPSPSFLSGGWIWAFGLRPWGGDLDLRAGI